MRQKAKRSEYWTSKLQKSGQKIRMTAALKWVLLNCSNLHLVPFAGHQMPPTCHVPCHVSFPDLQGTLWRRWLSLYFVRYFVLNHMVRFRKLLITLGLKWDANSCLLSEGDLHPFWQFLALDIMLRYVIC